MILKTKWKATHVYVSPMDGKETLVQDLGHADVGHRQVITKDGYKFCAGLPFLGTIPKKAKIQPTTVAELDLKAELLSLTDHFADALAKECLNTYHKLTEKEVEELAKDCVRPVYRLVRLAKLLMLSCAEDVAKKYEAESTKKYVRRLKILRKRRAGY